MLIFAKSAEFFQAFGIESTTRVIPKFGVARVVMQSEKDANFNKTQHSFFLFK